MMIAAVLQLRHSWGLPRRSAVQNAIAWGVMLIGTALALVGEGAWGLAVAALCSMATAALLIAYEGWTSPRGKARASNRRAHMLCDQREPYHIGRRLFTFVLTVPIGFGTSLLTALGARAVAGMAGWSDADGNIMALLLLPVFWGFLIFWLLMRPNRRGQFAWLATPAAAGLALIWVGGVL
ncbi:MAG: hypothetical protein R3E04_03115 [Sphingobium sp.]